MKTFLCDNADVITKITLAAENPTAQYIPDFVEKGLSSRLDTRMRLTMSHNRLLRKGRVLQPIYIMQCHQSALDERWE